MQDTRSCRILGLVFSFSPGILEILDPVSAGSLDPLPWDRRDRGSRTEMILLDPGDPGSSLRKLSCRYRGIWQILDFAQQYVTVS